MMEFLAFLFTYGAVCAIGAATITYYACRPRDIEPQPPPPPAPLPVARVVRW
jgi:hypothetical protein